MGWRWRGCCFWGLAFLGEGFADGGWDIPLCLIARWPERLGGIWRLGCSGIYVGKRGRGRGIEGGGCLYVVGMYLDGIEGCQRHVVGSMFIHAF
ncbi:uncharacterized protein B0H64DRAFT_379851 [Chaetomium fimeti]|uniref:Secreted protein n=1 Tax=Chaetomium fimeti TaxID=1854472 RepID=A0AAE0HNY6_9PEZI|nr:hypothetical protein B0H64DRAFT_379851 [Chaetomium fimeti]